MKNILPGSTVKYAISFLLLSLLSGLALAGSQWDITGTATDGNYASQSLQGVPHYNKIFWFSWALFKQNTRVIMAT